MDIPRLDWVDTYLMLWVFFAFTYLILGSAVENEVIAMVHFGVAIGWALLAVRRGYRGRARLSRN